MIVVLSPAKSLNLSREIDCQIATEPRFNKELKPLVDKLKKFSVKQIENKFSLSRNLAELNYDRFQNLGENENLMKTRQAIFTFDGDVYVGFDAYSLGKNKYDFTQNTIRILSGLYGILKPFDLIESYRLEMGSDLSVGRKKNLYQYWSESVTKFINEEEGKILVNLASNEYFKVINQKKLGAKILNIDFLEDDKKELKSISFFSKKARGLVARYIVDNHIAEINDIKGFDSERYSFNPKLSKDDRFVFVRKYQLKNSKST